MVMSVQLHAPAALPLGKSPLYPLDRRLRGPHIPSVDAVSEREREISYPAGNRTPVVKPVS